MNLLRWRPSTRTVHLELPDGSRKPVKVMTNDAHDVQHVEDWEGRIHGTGRPAPVAITVHTGPVQRRPLLLRNSGMPKIRQHFSRDHNSGLWAPVPGTIEERT